MNTNERENRLCQTFRRKSRKQIREKIYKHIYNKNEIASSIVFAMSSGNQVKFKSTYETQKVFLCGKKNKSNFFKKFFPGKSSGTLKVFFKINNPSEVGTNNVSRSGLNIFNITY